MSGGQTTWSFEAIGTKWQIIIAEPIDASHLADIQLAVDTRIRSFDAVYSRFRDDSLVTKIASKSGTYEFPEDSSRLFDLYRQLYDLSGGAVTPLIGQTMSDAGYDVAYSLQPKTRLNRPPDWPAVMQFRDRTLTTSQPVLLDFGAAGKGYLVDIITELLVGANVNIFSINAGGDIRCYGLDQPLKIGLEHPEDTTQMIGVLELTDGALCGSAGNRRAWAGYTHIIDPVSLTSPTDISATWCMAPDALTADGLATALYFVSPDQLRSAFTFEYCIVYADGSLQCSTAFKTAVFQPEEATTI